LPSSILGTVKNQKPYEPPPPKPLNTTTAPNNHHMDPLAAAEAMASGVVVRVKEIMRHPTFQKASEWPLCVYISVWMNE
jgi:hypothetical protein